MTKKLFIILIVSAFPFFTNSLESSDEGRATYGIFWNYHSNEFLADMRALPDFPKYLPLMADGTSTGHSIGILAEVKFTDVISAQMRGVYNFYDGTISRNFNDDVYLAGKRVEGTTESVLTADLSGLRFEPLLKITIIDEFSILGGFYVGYRFGEEFNHVSTVVSPENATFAGGVKSREISENTLTESGMQAAFTGGISYDIILSADRYWSVSLETLYSYGLTDVANSFTWDANSVRAGLSFRWSPLISEPVIEEIIEDTIPDPVEEVVEQPAIREPIIDVNAYRSKNGEARLDRIRMEEFLTTSTLPLLNYIFFDHNSSVIPTRYNALGPDEITGFRQDSSIYNSVLSTYYNVLNIIGMRMKNDMESTITLVGCNSGVAEEENNPGLSSARAGAVKKYLVDTWGIKENRIKTRSRNLPANPAKSGEEAASEENRRVEIYPGSGGLTDPVVINDTSLIVEPERFFIKSDANEMMKPTAWQLQMMYGNDIVKEISGKGEFPSEIAIETSELPLSDIDDGSMLYMLQVNSEKFKSIRSQVKPVVIDKLTIEEKRKSSVEDKYIDRYSLIIFDYDKFDLNERNNKIISFINSRLQANSSVTIDGYTDNLGDENYNLQLSENRARAAADALKSKNNRVVITYQGYGETSPIYNNSLPEGRFYNRTVNVIVETPVEK